MLDFLDWNEKDDESFAQDVRNCIGFPLNFQKKLLQLFFADMIHLNGLSSCYPMHPHKTV